MKTDWKDDIFTQRKIRLTENSDGTVTPVDETVYTQQGDSFGAKELNAIGEEINEVKKSVSDGKALVAAAITAKRVDTAATAPFAKMAENIKAIRLGSGNALKAHVLAGKTFTNDDGVEYTGEMPERAGEQIPASQVTKSGNAIVMKSSRNGHINETTTVAADQSAVASAAGVNGAVIRAGYDVLGVPGQIQSMAGQVIAPQTYSQTISCAGKYMTSDITVYKKKPDKRATEQTRVNRTLGSTYELIQTIDVNPEFGQLEVILYVGDNETRVTMTNLDTNNEIAAIVNGVAVAALKLERTNATGGVNFYAKRLTTSQGAVSLWDYTNYVYE